MSSSRRPTWSLVTFADIEFYRTAHKLTKRGMAELLEVTNSTYHNWARGQAVPTRSAQRHILRTLKGGQDTPAVVPNGEMLLAVSAIVSTYLRTCKRKMSTGEVVELVAATRTALGA